MGSLTPCQTLLNPVLGLAVTLEELQAELIISYFFPSYKEVSYENSSCLSFNIITQLSFSCLRTCGNWVLLAKVKLVWVGWVLNLETWWLGAIGQSYATYYIGSGSHITVIQWDEIVKTNSNLVKVVIALVVVSNRKH